jgi:MFS family permease
VEHRQFWILISSIVGRLSIGYFADIFPKKWVMTATYFVVSATIPLLLFVRPPKNPIAFAIVFGLAMGADYMLIPLMAAEQFGVNSLARAMAIILPANTIGQTWFPQLVSILREHYGSYTTPLTYIFLLAMLGALAIAILPKHSPLVDPKVPIGAPGKIGV